MAEDIHDDGAHVAEVAGDPARVREQLGRAFLKAIADDFVHNGKKAIETVREERPHDYVRLVAALLPKEFPCNPGIEDMTDDELARALTEIRSTIAAKTPEPDGVGDAKAREPGADRS